MNIFLHVPLWIWIAQLSYVIFALSLLYALVRHFSPHNSPSTLVIVLYVLGMVIVNIAWRLLAAKLK